MARHASPFAVCAGSTYMQPEEQKAGTEERKYSLMALLSEHPNDYSILFISPTHIAYL